MSQTRELLKGVSPLLLLSVLCEEPRYGYQIIRTLEERCSGNLRFKEGTIYPALRKLEAEGLVKGRWERSPQGKKRRYYRLTARGARELRQQARGWQSFAGAVRAITRRIAHAPALSN